MVTCNLLAGKRRYEQSEKLPGQLGMQPIEVFVPSINCSILALLQMFTTNKFNQNLIISNVTKKNIYIYIRDCRGSIQMTNGCCNFIRGETLDASELLLLFWRADAARITRRHGSRPNGSVGRSLKK